MSAMLDLAQNFGIGVTSLYSELGGNPIFPPGSSASYAAGCPGGRADGLSDKSRLWAPVARSLVKIGIAIFSTNLLLRFMPGPATGRAKNGLFRTAFLVILIECHILF